MKLNNIKNTFEKREIKPSAGSWDVLSARLDEDDKKSKKPVVIYWLSAIAAIFIAALLLYPSLSNEAIINSDDKIVNTLPLNTDNAKDDLLIVEPKLERDKNIDVASTVNTEVQNNDDSNNNAIKNQSIAQNNKQPKTVNSKVKDQAINVQNPASFLNIDKALSKGNEDTAMASVSNQHIIEKQLTAEEEMELLLNKAMGKVEVTEVAVKTINPDKLLRETEWDIESDNRSKLQNSIQGGLNFLRAEAVAIVDRNK
ncbi:hypothetical protein JCM19296_1998 [Nonlabens ulvanivorans]|uniref:Uncharacterized protein n=1 Tax=Nonlabens ulvanivorans TaxID=906888 RepID=A0A081DBV5_NONUL|nr:hypothetical protein [Nonlabens ulvanivorans]GAK76401.1 hypothetical protein JCM19296_1998 [Nonlabens ulvanivorans]